MNVFAALKVSMFLGLNKQEAESVTVCTVTLLVMKPSSYSSCGRRYSHCLRLAELIIRFTNLDRVIILYSVCQAHSSPQARRKGVQNPRVRECASSLAREADARTRRLQRVGTVSLYKKNAIYPQTPFFFFFLKIHNLCFGSKTTFIGIIVNPNRYGRRAPVNCACPLCTIRLSVAFRV